MIEISYELFSYLSEIAVSKEKFAYGLLVYCFAKSGKRTKIHHKTRVVQCGELLSMVAAKCGNDSSNTHFDKRLIIPHLSGTKFILLRVKNYFLLDGFVYKMN